MTTNPNPVDLLKRAESYLSALHGSVARHDNLAANLGCAGCELRDQISAALLSLATAPSSAPADRPTPDFTSPIAGRIEVREPCPWCPDRPMVPRSLMGDHCARLHPDVQTASAVVSAAAPPTDRGALRDRIAAYRSPGTRTLYCIVCARQESGWQPVTAAGVKDDTVCDFCGGRILAVAAMSLGDVIARYVDGESAAAVLPPPADRTALVATELEQLLATEPDDTKALDLHDALMLVRAKFPCTCARSQGLHETGCRRYVPGHDLLSPARRLARAREELRRPAAETAGPETQAGRTPCDQPNACDGDELCATHEEEQAHADGEHEYCGPTCEVQFPTELLRNSILAKGYPGTAGMLDELLRRAAAGLLPAAVQTEEA